MSLYEILSLVLSGLVIFTGCFAILVYYFQERNKIKTAARLVMSQISQIETNVAILQNEQNLNVNVIYASKSLLPHNYWEENKHHLTRKFNESQKHTIDFFYASAEEIEKARKNICNSIDNSWKNKDLVFQYMLMSGIANGEDNDVLYERLNKYDQSPTTYFPKLPIDYLMKNLYKFSPISGTVVFNKLYKLSK